MPVHKRRETAGACPDHLPASSSTGVLNNRESTESQRGVATASSSRQGPSRSSQARSLRSVASR